MSYSVHFSFFTFFSVSHHISCPTTWVSHFPRLWFSPHIAGRTVIVSISILVSSLTIFQLLHCVFLILHLFQNPRYIPRPTMCVSHFTSFSVLSPYCRSYSVHFSFSTFFSFLSIIQVLKGVFLIFEIFQGFSPYFTSYGVHFSFSTFFSVSRHIPVHTVFLSHFPRFSVFSP